MRTFAVSASLLDANVWVALTFPSHPHHLKTKAYFSACTPTEPALFCRSTQQSFLRLATTPAILKAYGAEGLTNRDALSVLQTLIGLPQVSFVEEPKGLEQLWYRLADLDSASPKVWMDAYLAAFAITAGHRFVTLDRDFQNLRKHRLKLLLLEEWNASPATFS